MEPSLYQRRWEVTIASRVDSPRADLELWGEIGYYAKKEPFEVPALRGDAAPSSIGVVTQVWPMSEFARSRHRMAVNPPRGRW